jgi:type III pantothenate kinase
MKLILDLGNTTSKIAVFDGRDLLWSGREDNGSLVQRVSELKRQYPALAKGILSKVGHLDEVVLQGLQNQLPLHLLSYRSLLPFNNAYSTPETLGVDRLALASAASLYYPGKNVLVIDAGTCITYDFINEKASYLGGAISPGLRIRYEALHNFTAKLPLLSTAVPEDLIGKSTEASIHSGVVNGVCMEIEGLVKAYKLRHKHLTVILTGGDAKFLSDQLKNSIFANSNFLIAGLNYLLDYNS